MQPFALRTVISAIIPAILVVILLALLIAQQFQGNRISHSHDPFTPLSGTPLSALPDLYPVKSTNGVLNLDIDKLNQAVMHLLSQKNPKAAADLIYIVQANNTLLMLDHDNKVRFFELVEKYHYEDILEIRKHKDAVFSVYTDIVNGIGRTFAGTGVEIVLHDTRNPLASIIAIQNPISGRRLGDSTTNFGLELIREYAAGKSRGVSFISYGLTLSDGRDVKSSTIPIYDPRFGLIGFICMNIDVSKLDEPQSQAALSFLENFAAVNENTKINELIDHSKRNG